MVAFRNVANGQGVDNFTTGTANQIAFNRGAKALWRSIMSSVHGMRRYKLCYLRAHTATLYAVF